MTDWLSQPIDADFVVIVALVAIVLTLLTSRISR